MEEMGVRVAVPVLAQLDVDNPYCGQPLLAKKRDYLCHQSLGRQYKRAVQPPFEAMGKDWNPSSWHWDSSRFVVRALESENSRSGKGHAKNNAMGGMNEVPGVSERDAGDIGKGEDDDDRLRLNLGGGMKIAEEPLSRPSKRIRPESAGDNCPMCQVNNCREDLSNVKDYHRHHKVCEAHSKAADALVGKHMSASSAADSTSSLSLMRENGVAGVDLLATIGEGERPNQKMSIQDFQAKAIKLAMQTGMSISSTC